MASSASDGRRTRAAALVAAALVASAAGARAQDAVRPPGAPPGADDEPVPTLPDGTRTVRGRVVLPRGDHEDPVAGTWVTLHRVGADRAGPMDSVRTDARGAYAIRYRPSGDPRAIYFVATSRGGVAYFTPPLRSAAASGDAAEVTVFDTTSRPVRLAVRGRHLIVQRPGADGAREVLEVFELSNDTLVTAVPGGAQRAGVWSTPLPTLARGLAVRESGDLPSDGLVAVGQGDARRAALVLPVAPGLKQVAFSYQLPAGAFPLRVPLEGTAEVLEVLLEDSGGTATGAGLAMVAPVALEGKNFRRFVAQDARAGGAVDVALAAGVASSAWPRAAVPVLLAVIGGGMVLVLVATSRRAKAPPVAAAPAPTPAPAAAPPVREARLAELAALDDAWAARDPARPATPAERAAYESRRRALKEELADAV